jgi:outer membrane autotransporter protein
MPRYRWTTLGNLHERVGEEEQLRDRDDLRSRNTFNGAWVRVIGENGDADGDRRGIYGSNGPHYDYNIIALQAGVDVYAQEHDNQQRDHAGLYLGQGRIQSDVTHFDHTYAGSDAVTATSLGLYWSHFWQEGQYLDAVWQGSWAKATSCRSPVNDSDPARQAVNDSDPARQSSKAWATSRRRRLARSPSAERCRVQDQKGGRFPCRPLLH